MNYRTADVLTEEDASSAKTKTIDLTLRDIVSRMFIRFKAKNAGVRATLLANPAALITKIELVDGSDVLFSLNGYEAQALNYYDQLVTPDTEIIDGDNDWQHACFMIDFGRFLFDPVLAFDPTKFTNPQLKITHNYKALDANAVEGKLLVQAHIFDEKVPTPTGFLMSKEIQTYSSGDDTYEYVEIPTDHPMRQLLVRAYLTNKSFESEINEIRLSEDNDKRIPFDLSIEPYIRYLCGTLPPIHEHFQLRAQTSATYFYIIATYWPIIYGMSQTVADWVRSSAAYEGEKQAMASATQMSSPFMGYATGYVPHQTLSFPFGLQQEIADWYDVTKLGSLRARLHGTSGASAAEVTLFSQQVRNY